MRWVKTIVPGVLIASVVSSGCAPDGTTARPPDEYALDMVVQGGQFQNDADALAAAEDRLVSACMRGQGIAFPQEQRSAGYDEALTGRTYIQARYRGSPPIMVSSGGCRGRARAELAGSVKRWATAFYAPGYLLDDLIRHAGTDDPAALRTAAATMPRDWQAETAEVARIRRAAVDATLRG
jgi:hypothetical protein